MRYYINLNSGVNESHIIVGIILGQNIFQCIHNWCKMSEIAFFLDQDMQIKCVYVICKGVYSSSFP